MSKVALVLQLLKNEDTRKKLMYIAIIPVAIILLIFSMFTALLMGTADSAQTTPGTAVSSVSEEVEAWRPLVTTYCEKYGITGYEDLALALIQAESSGNEPDPMQAAEGAYGMYCIKTKNNKGGHVRGPCGIPEGHGECSINAGIQELRDALKKANVESPYDIDHIKVAIQGYNYGMNGWITWINQHGGKYTLELSQEYSDTKMPAGAKGTPNHAEKVMRYYSIATGDQSAEVSILDGNSGIKVVYYNQGDAAWKSLRYGSTTIGEGGCGPTSMAICISTFTGKKITPRITATWAAENGYEINGGSSHAIVPALAKQYKLKCEAVGRDRNKIIKALQSGKLVVVIVGPGHFTNCGHFFVLTGIKDGKITVADCGSRTNTQKTWSLDLIINESRPNAGAGGPFWIISK